MKPSRDGTGWDSLRTPAAAQSRSHPLLDPERVTAPPRITVTSPAAGLTLRPVIATGNSRRAWPAGR